MDLLKNIIVPPDYMSFLSWCTCYSVITLTVTSILELYFIEKGCLSMLYLVRTHEYLNVFGFQRLVLNCEELLYLEKMAWNWLFNRVIPTALLKSLLFSLWSRCLCLMVFITRFWWMGFLCHVRQPVLMVLLCLLHLKCKGRCCCKLLDLIRVTEITCYCHIFKHSRD